jgi:hypothetical protein
MRVTGVCTAAARASAPAGWAAAGLACLVLVACEPALQPAQFTGVWKSSRLATPLHLKASGEWEIRAGDGPVLQYGVWRLEGRHIVWTYRTADGRPQHESNAEVSAGGRRFELRERDGSLTSFERLP